MKAYTCFMQPQNLIASAHVNNLNKLARIISHFWTLKKTKWATFYRATFTSCIQSHIDLQIDNQLQCFTSKRRDETQTVDSLLCPRRLWMVGAEGTLSAPELSWLKCDSYSLAAVHSHHHAYQLSQIFVMLMNLGCSYNFANVVSSHAEKLEDA